MYKLVTLLEAPRTLEVGNKCIWRWREQETGEKEKKKLQTFGYQPLASLRYRIDPQVRRASRVSFDDVASPDSFVLKQ